MDSPLYIGVDFGTSGCRAVAIDPRGVVQAEAATQLPAPVRVGPASTQDPRLWWEGLERVLDSLLARIPPETVSAIAVDGTSGSLLLSDAAGEPLGSALMYDDARAVEAAERIARTAPQDTAAHGPGSALAKLLYLLEQPGAQHARHALHQADWVCGRLMGRFGLSDEHNCLKLGYDPRTRRWPGWLAELGVPHRLLPHVRTPGSPIASVAHAVAERFGLSAACRVVAGTTDSTASVIASGAALPGDAVTSLGTTLVLKVVSPVPIFAPRHGVYSHPFGGLWLVGGGSNSGGGVLRHYFTREKLAELSARLDPNRPTGLDYYPLLRPGERFPINDPTLPPRIEPRPVDDAVFLQGLLESIAAIEHRGYRLLAELGAPYPTSVRSTGGGAHNGAWTAIRAHLLGVSMRSAEHEEASYGAALLALRSTAHADAGQ
jgi:D-ribulokinase